MSIIESTKAYETRLRAQCDVYEPDLDEKHATMAASVFPFFRGTYYRWAETWQHGRDESKAPAVLSVGDLHVENFGTWRDVDGRLIWGANDFDEADVLPYTNDLVRLAASVRLAGLNLRHGVKFGQVCDWIVQGYAGRLQTGGEPFVLEENHAHLRTMATSREREPVAFWKKFVGELGEVVVPPASAVGALVQSLPAGAVVRSFHRRRAGVGSLGKPRFVLMATWGGANVAREAKATTPPATNPAGPSRASELLGKLARCPDPFYRPLAAWTVRRLGPRCSKIELDRLEQLAEFQSLFTAMGAETANVHLASPAAAGIAADLAKRNPDWLKDAAKATADATQADWPAWQKHFRR